MIIFAVIYEYFLLLIFFVDFKGTARGTKPSGARNHRTKIGRKSGGTRKDVATALPAQPTPSPAAVPGKNTITPEVDAVMAEFVKTTLGKGW